MRNLVQRRKLLIVVCSTSNDAASRHPRVNLSTEASDARLELMVLDGVDEGIDAAVDENHHHAERVKPTRWVSRIADEHHNKCNLIERPAYDEAAADDQ